ncbi:MAG: aldose 1-epimerase family protein [Chloroflexi bacterium]|nr:aldose 1-epimerase family protein [Chloroflexota bacterium]
MPQLFGKSYTREELRARVGDLAQIAGITSATLNDGSENGVRTFDVHTGSGLRFTVLPDRAMDIAMAQWRGVPLAYHSSTGVLHPSYFESAGLGLLRSFYGGLLTTCGLMNVAVPADDSGEHFGLHGRFNHIPAKNVSYDTFWRGDEYVLTMRGKVRETRFFGENVLLTRTITTTLGSTTIAIEDVIENQGFEPTPLMILYHVNPGFPILDADSELLINSEIIPRDAEASKGLAVAKRGAPPTPGFKEQVHQHKVKADSGGWATAALVNRHFNAGQGIGLCVRYRPDELPYFWQWRMVGQGAYVMGLEPANCHVMGRAEERRQGRLPMLAAGALLTHHLEISVLTSAEEIQNIAQHTG